MPFPLPELDPSRSPLARKQNPGAFDLDAHPTIASSRSLEPTCLPNHCLGSALLRPAGKSWASHAVIYRRTLAAHPAYYEPKHQPRFNVGNKRKRSPQPSTWTSRFNLSRSTLSEFLRIKKIHNITGQYVDRLDTLQ